MIKFLKQKSIKVSLDEVVNIQDADWVYVVDPTVDELVFLHNKSGIKLEKLKQVLDTEERSRLEISRNYIFLVINFSFQDNEGSFDTLPLGIFITEQYIITIVMKEVALFKNLLEERIDFNIKEKSHLLLNIMNIIARQFVKDVKLVIKNFENIERKLFKATKNSDIVKIMSLQQTLTFFSTSLYANDLLNTRIMRLRFQPPAKDTIVNFEKWDEELLEDIYTETKQGLEMVGMYSSVLTNMMDMFTSMIANNQNTFLKILSLITFFLTIPMIFSSFWGMNVAVPYKDTRFGFWYVAALSIIIIIISLVVYILWNKPKRSIK